MRVAPHTTPVQAFAPDFAHRLGIILAALAALIARRFLREPRLAALIVPLWSRLQRAARRFERLMARLAAGKLRKPHRSGPSGPHATALPAGRGWLIRALGPEAAPYATQLETLLAEPAAAGLLAAVPAARRIVHPIARLLAIGAFAPRRRPAPVPAVASPFGEVAYRSQGYTWYEVPTPPANPV
jgi:hypothetical protein